MAMILIVEDDPVTARLLTLLLKNDGHDVKTVATAEDAIESGHQVHPDMVVTDWLLQSEKDGIDVARALHADNPEIKILFVTGLPTDQLRKRTRDLPLVEIFEKPLDLDILLETVRREFHDQHMHSMA
jgi:two-component system, cell cycle response regulator CpdR